MSHFSTARPRFTGRLTMAAGVMTALLQAGVHAQVTVNYASPTLDRWMYPFAATPGFETRCSVFGAFSAPDFDNRDSQMLVGFDTAAEITPGLPPAAYQVVSVTLTVAAQSDNTFVYDPTSDPFGSYRPIDDAAHVADADGGRPVELFGVGFRGGFALDSFTETSPWGPTAGPSYRSLRNAYASRPAADGSPVDVSNSVDAGLDPAPFAVGQCNLSPGASVPAGTDFTFSLNVADPVVQRYVAEGLSAGKIRLMITAMHPAALGGPVNYPRFYTKEAGLPNVAARLSVTFSVVATQTPVATATPAPTATISAAATATPAPSATAAPTATPNVTTTPSVTPTPATTTTPTPTPSVDDPTSGSACAACGSPALLPILLAALALASSVRASSRRPEA